MWILTLLFVIVDIVNCQTVATVAQVFGKVEVFRPHLGNWIKVTPKMLLEKDYRIRTGEDSKLKIVLRDGSVIFIAENTELDLSDLYPERTKIKLKRGKIKNNIKPLKKGAIFEVETPNATVSVRGTEFIVVFEEDKTTVYVIKGEVEFKNIRTGKSMQMRKYESCIISADMVEKEKVSKHEINKISDEFLLPVVAEEDFILPEREELKRELGEFVRDIRTDGRVVREFLQEVKDADFSAGRTLLDVHGNIVRVEQLVLRPDPYTLQFLNLTKRDGYKYRGHFGNFDGAGYRYRLDAADFRIKFNIALPTDLLEFPFWAYEHHKDLFIKDVDFVLSCRTKLGEDKFGFVSKERESRYKELRPDFMIEKFDKTNNTRETWLSGTKPPKGLPEPKSGGGYDGKLWFWTEVYIPMREAKVIGEEILPKADGKTENFKFQSEFYLINNKGEILSADYFLKSEHKDPFSILKELAFENIHFIKKPDGSDFFKNRNIDLVSTPDIIISVVKKIVERIDKIVEAVRRGGAT